MNHTPTILDDVLSDIRLYCAKDLAEGEGLEPHEVEHLIEQIGTLDALICNGGELPRDWTPRRAGPPRGLLETTQVWVGLREERTRVTEAENGELDYDTTRQFEEEQEDAAIQVAVAAEQFLLAAGWL